MARHGEAHTHVAALLFAIEANVQTHEMKRVTQEKAYWMLPYSLKKVNYRYSPVNYRKHLLYVSQKQSK